MQEITSVTVRRHVTMTEVGREETQEEKFVPKGAIAFFLLMLVVYAGMWFSMYFNLIGRH